MDLVLTFFTEKHIKIHFDFLQSTLQMKATVFEFTEASLDRT